MNRLVQEQLRDTGEELKLLPFQLFFCTALGSGRLFMDSKVVQMTPACLVTSLHQTFAAAAITNHKRF